MAASSDSPSLVGVNSGKLQCFRRLFKIDTTIAEVVAAHAKIIALGNESWREILNGCIMAESSGEGCMLPRLFLPSNELPDNINREIEWDKEYVALDVDTSYIFAFKIYPISLNMWKCSLTTGSDSWVKHEWN